MPKLTRDLCVIEKDGKPFCKAANIADARLIVMACEEWWRQNKNKGLTS